MAEITLREYCDQAKKLIRDESYNRAIAICRHILKHYPKHIRSYRLMGEASLERGDYVEAANLFKRVLSADMEDVVVYAGLGIVYDEEGAVDEAIWQLERAFELTPGNAEIRKELQRLYAQRDGEAPPKLKLTPAALGRLYLREGLYQRAIDEFRGVLEEDPERVDIQVTLAQALWWNEQRREAAEVCEEILEQFPNCLKANLILGEILFNSDREDEGRALLDTAQAMDPENIVAHELFGDQSPLPLETVGVPRLDEEGLQQEVEEIRPELPAVAEKAEAEEAPPLISEEELEEAMPDWLRKLQEGEREPVAEGEVSPLTTEEMPDWLRELATERPVDAEAAALAEEQRSATEEGELPAWVRDIRGVPEYGQAEEGPVPVPPAEEAPVEGEPETIGGPEAEFPPAEEEGEVLREEPTVTLEEPEREFAEAVPPEGRVEELPALEDEDVPDWLSALRAEEAESVSLLEQAVSAEEEEVPAWLRELREEPGAEELAAPPQEMVGPAEVPLKEMPDRERPPETALEEERPVVEEEVEISEETMVRLREIMPDESASIEEIMAWMERSKAMLAEDEVFEAHLEEKAEAPEAEEEVPPWLAELRPEEQEVEARVDEEAMPIEEKELPTWLRDLRPEAAEEEVVARGEEREISLDEAPVPSPKDEEVPSPPVQVRAEATEEEAEPPVEEELTPLMEEEEIPSWLRELRAEAVKKEEPVPTGEPEAPVEEPPMPPMEEEEVPSWLRELRAEAVKKEESVPTGEPEAPVEEPPMPPMEEEEAPSWLRELRAEAAKEEEPMPTEEPEAPVEEPPIPPMEEEEVPTWLRELRAEAAREEALAPSEAPAAEVELPPMEEDDIPSWLRELRAEAVKEAAGPPEAAEPALEEIGAPPVEEELPTREVVTAEERAAAAPSVAEPVRETVRAGWGIEEYRRHLESNPQDDRTRLDLARAYGRNRNWDEAASEYELILSHGTMFDEVIEELESVAEDAPDHLPTHELLADAYMKGGHLQKALDKYRWLRVVLSG